MTKGYYITTKATIEVTFFREAENKAHAKSIGEHDIKHILDSMNENYTINKINSVKAE